MFFENFVIVKYNEDGKPLWAKALVSGNNPNELVSIVSTNDGLYAVGALQGSDTFNFGNNITINCPYSKDQNAV